jgi:hypothetical protein
MSSDLPAPLLRDPAKSPLGGDASPHWIPDLGENTKCCEHFAI